MGIKLFNLHSIPFSCFHLIGAHISCVQLGEQPRPIATVKLIRWDGSVKIYDRPIHVSELLLDHPKHLVCRSDSFFIGRKIPSLSEHDQLQLGHKYFLLPQHLFNSVLSFVTVASLFAACSHHQQRQQKTVLLKNAAACQQPFHVHKSSSGCLSIRVSDEFISQLLEEGNAEAAAAAEEEEKISGSLCTTPHLLKEYAQLVRSRQWKPKLETIKEKDNKKHSSFKNLNPTFKAIYR